MGEKVGTPQQRIAAKERQVRALELRKAGLTYQQIADALGYGSHSAAQKAVETGLKNLPREAAEAVRQLELERLDKIISSHWNPMLKGHVRSTEVIIRAMERRAGLLGLDAPKDINLGVQVDAVHIIGVPEEVI